MARRMAGMEVDKKQVIKDYKKMIENRKSRKEGNLLLSPQDIAFKNSCTKVRIYQILKEKGINVKQR